MLRECARVLVPGGRIALLSIHVSPDLSEEDQRRAVELGPTMGASSEPLPDLLKSAGFVEVVEIDRTEAFAQTCETILRIRDELDARLRSEEGDEAFEVELTKKRNMLEGIQAGLLRRSLLTARV